MSDRGVFVASKNFCQLHSRSEFLKNTCEEKEALKLAKENILTDIFHGFEPPGNLMKWFNLRLQVFLGQTCSKSAICLVIYKLYVIFEFCPTKKCFSSSIVAPILRKTCSSLNLEKVAH